MTERAGRVREEVTTRTVDPRVYSGELGARSRVRHEQFFHDVTACAQAADCRAQTCHAIKAGKPRTSNFLLPTSNFVWYRYRGFEPRSRG